MADALASYASDSVNVVCAGLDINGFTDGTHINIQLDGEGVMVRNGNDGSVGRAISPKRTATITLNLMQTASGNAILMNLWQIDQVSNGQGAFPLLIEDLSGGVLFSSGAAWCIKPPDAPMSAGIENREWKLQAFMSDVTKFFTNAV